MNKDNLFVALVFFIVFDRVVCLSKIHYLYSSSGILKQEYNAYVDDRKDYIHWANSAFARRKWLTRKKPILSSWNTLGTGR